MKCFHILRLRWRSNLFSPLHLDIPEDYLERLKTEPTTDSVLDAANGVHRSVR